MKVINHIIDLPFDFSYRYRLVTDIEKVEENDVDSFEESTLFFRDRVVLNRHTESETPNVHQEYIPDVVKPLFNQYIWGFSGDESEIVTRVNEISRRLIQEISKLKTI